MQPVAFLTLQMTPPHAVVFFQMPNDGFNRLASGQ
jgi:hypothetical protein